MIQKFSSLGETKWKFTVLAIVSPKPLENFVIYLALEKLIVPCPQE
jgi:hypothetical protein